MNPPPTSAPPFYLNGTMSRFGMVSHKKCYFWLLVIQKSFSAVFQIFFCSLFRKKFLCHQVVHLRFGTMTMVVFTEHQTSPSTTTINVRSTDLWEAECLHGGCMKQNSRTDENCSYAVGIFDSPQTTRCTKGEGPFRYSLVSMSSKAANCNQWCLRQLFFCDLLFSKIWFAHIFTFCWQHVWEERCGLAWMATWMCSIVFLVDSGGGFPRVVMLPFSFWCFKYLLYILTWKGASYQCPPLPSSSMTVFLLGSSVGLF